MRSDMHKVVVERPRWNPGAGKRGRRANLPDELLPKFEGIKRPHVQRKALTDLLGPLKRWLHSQLGRPWDDIYSEACAVIKPDSVVRAHIKTHLLQLVHRHTFMKDDEVWCFTGHWTVEELPLRTAANHRAQFYVDPVTRLLCKVPVGPRRRWKDRGTESRRHTQRRLDGATLLRLLNGCWFECKVKAFPHHIAKGDSPWRFDLAERKMICSAHAQEIYGRDVYCIAKRQLSRRELKQFGVSNLRERSLQPVTLWLVDDCAPAIWCRPEAHRCGRGGSTPPSCRGPCGRPPGLQTLTVKSRLLTGENSVRIRGNPPFSHPW